MRSATVTLAALLCLAGATGAQAWERNRSLTGPRGTATFDASGSCADGRCSRAVTRTGPAGRTASRQGSAGCQDGTCSGTRTTTGPAGATVTRQGSISR
ncbi:hypothetical protein [Azospirillum sp. A39]|uniref:hypothetical protein n=1 Tax=Azospirillum sp. A39 TaxID=3462279 RepID=UPI0040453824